MNPAANPEVFIWDSRKLSNLGEMIKHVCSMVCAVIEGLLSAMLMLGSRIRTNGESSPIAENDKKQILNVLADARKECNYLGLEDAANHIVIIETRLRNNCSLMTAHVELQNLNTAIFLGLSKRDFAFIRTPLAGYFEKDRLFGDGVYEEFESARLDIKESGNCLSAELFTAAVFHLMRVSEHGLRGLSRKVNVRLTHKGKTLPIEFAEWDKVITAIKNKIDASRKLPSGPRRQARLEFYSDAADHCLFMKEIWRNNVSHTRKPYIEAEALAVFNRVKDFMLFLGREL